MTEFKDVQPEQLDHQRWLINNGFINDLHKDTLYMYGAIVHKDVKAVHAQVKVENKCVSYVIYVSNKHIKKMNRFIELKNSSGVFGLWKFKRMLKTEGNLDLKFIIDRFVKDYCGPMWKAEVQIENFVNYKDDLEEEKTNSEPGINQEADKLPD